jgi:RNA polymerase sigma factor (sigma-70 family)
VFRLRAFYYRPMGLAANNTLFATTHWSVILTAGKEIDSPHAREALETLCRTYWYPLYAYVRRQGHAPEDAEDLTQAFFARLLEKKYVANARRERGRFRTFLLTSLKRFLVNDWHRACTARRGRGQPVISFDGLDAESRLLLEPADDGAPELTFERHWAEAVLAKVLARVETEFRTAGKAEQFAVLKGFLGADHAPPSYAKASEELGLNEAAVKMAVSRLRGRYRELLREELAHTVARPEDVDEELRHLIAVMKGV